MRKAFRRAAPLLLAAAAFGLNRPAAAQAPAPLPQSLGATDDVPPLPRVLSPLHAPAAPAVGQAAPLPQPPASAPASPRLDLLTSPPLPSAWTNPAAKPAGAPAPTAAAVRPAPSSSYPASLTPPIRSAYPSTTPAAATPVKADGAPWAAARPAAPTAEPPMAAAPAKPIVLSPLPPGSPAASMPAVAPASKAPPPAPPVASPSPQAVTPPVKKVWPPAFQTRDESKPYETTGLVSFEKSAPPAKPAAVAKPSPAVVASSPTVAAPTDLKGRIMAGCGPDALEVTVAARPDKTTLVRVRVRDAAAEQKVMQKILAMPEMGSPATRLEMVVKP